MRPKFRRDRGLLDTAYMLFGAQFVVVVPVCYPGTAEKNTRNMKIEAMLSNDRRTTHGVSRITGLMISLALVVILSMSAGAADYGRELACVHTIDKPGVMDVVVVGNHLFFIGSGKLYIADIANPASPQLISECSFHGQGRQLAVDEGIAYVTARADGVYIIDVRDPKKPEMLCHYDCIELATGVEVQGDLLFIAQRQYGVEIVNIADPRNPVYVSKIKTGEAQSVDVRGDTIYAGDWGVSKLTTIDISDPYKPEIVASHDLDGYGDGVCVAGEYLYASTGHHSRHMGAYREEGDPGYGAGHGLEVFSLEDPREPKFLGRTKFPKFYHRGGYDMWTPVAAGDVVCCADTFNGVFLVNVKDPTAPRTVAHFPELVGGVAVVDDFIYAACPEAGLKVLAAPFLVKAQKRKRGQPISVPPPPQQAAKDHRVYRPGGQVWSVDFCGDYALVAAGMKGVRLVELWPHIREVASIETQGFAVHACAAGDRVYVSENTGGLSIWQYAGAGKLEPLGRYRPSSGKSVRQTMVYADGKYAVAQVGSLFEILDVSDPRQPRKVAQHKAAIIYGDQMSHGDLAGRYAAVWGHVYGIRWLDFAASGKEINTGVNMTGRYSFFAGMVSLGDEFLCTFPGCYRLAKPLDTNLEEKPAYSFEGRFLGKPSLFGNGLFLTSRVNSAIAIVDIEDLHKPRLLAEFPTDGNPSTAVVRNKTLIIPDGHNGLLIYDDFVSTLDLDVDKETFLGL